MGGKRLLSKVIIPKLKATPHTCYVEPFVGMGGIFFRRPFTAQCEVINDFDKELTNLFRILQRHYTPFLDMLKWQVNSRAEFDRLKKTDPESLTDLERAARFISLQRMVFAGKHNGVFGVTTDAASRLDLSKLVPRLEEVYARLSRVTIECLPWQDLIPRYDRDYTLFYLDPPYYGTENYYRAPFKRAEFEEMADILRGLKGKFILSLNDHPEIRRIFDGFKLEEVQTTYSISKERGVKVGELIISNF